MTNTERRNDERYCTCKNSKCMKLYCDCFAARMPCGKNCRCFDCQNTHPRDNNQRYYPEKKLTREEMIRLHKGCACRRSNCVKKYCDCFQSGILCRDSCKCVECQNNQSLTNRKVINQLRRNNSQLSSNQNSINLYPLYISQNSQHLKSIIAESNPLTLQENWLDKAAKMLYNSALDGNASLVFDNFLSILSQLQENMTQQHLKFKQEQSYQAAQMVQGNMRENSGQYEYQDLNSQKFKEESEYQHPRQQNMNYSVSQAEKRHKIQLCKRKMLDYYKNKDRAQDEAEETEKREANQSNNLKEEEDQ